MHQGDNFSYLNNTQHGSIIELVPFQQELVSLAIVNNTATLLPTEQRMQLFASNST